MQPSFNQFKIRIATDLQPTSGIIPYAISGKISVDKIMSVGES